MSNGTTMLTFFVLAVFVGFEVVSKVSSVPASPACRRSPQLAASGQ